MSTQRIDHPAFVQLELSRVTCSSAQHFYASDTTPTEFIQISVKRSHLAKFDSDHNLTPFTNHEAPLLEARLTAAQFAEFVSSMNYGSGCPATLTVFNGQRVEPVKPLNTATDNAAERLLAANHGLLEKLSAKISELTRFQEAKKTPSKKTVDDAIAFLKHIQYDLSGKTEFFLKEVTEAIENTKLAAYSDLRLKLSSLMNTQQTHQIKDDTHVHQSEKFLQETFLRNAERRIRESQQRSSDGVSTEDRDDRSGQHGESA